MKQYPSIQGPSKAPRQTCVAFYKHDGSNLRFEWSRKQGWHKFGTRHTLFDESDPLYGPAIGIFSRKYADGISGVMLEEKRFRNVRSVIVFAEFFGQRSFAGQHEPGDEMDLVLFDVSPHKMGLLSPCEFLGLFGHLHVPLVVYEGNMNGSLIEGVRQNRLSTTLNEGVVCKGGSGHDLWMCKIKTLSYLERLKARYQDGWKDYWEEG
jgi:hypothetical protein